MQPVQGPSQGLKGIWLRISAFQKARRKFVCGKPHALSPEADGLGGVKHSGVALELVSPGAVRLVNVPCGTEGMALMQSDVVGSAIAPTGQECSYAMLNGCPCAW